MIDLQKLKCFRVMRNLTQEDVARKINVSATTYSRYERGLSNIPSDILKTLAEYFEVSVDELYT